MKYSKEQYLLVSSDTAILEYGERNSYRMQA